MFNKLINIKTKAATYKNKPAERFNKYVEEIAEDDNDNYGQISLDFYKQNLPALKILFKRCSIDDIPEILSRIAKKAKISTDEDYFIKHHLKVIEMSLLGHILMNNINKFSTDKILKLADSLLDKAGFYEPTCVQVTTLCFLKSILYGIPAIKKDLIEHVQNRYDNKSSGFEKLILEEFIAIANQR